MLRVLLIFHGRLPFGPWPVAGMALRAWTLAQGLQAHGIEVLFASRRRDQPLAAEVGRPSPPPPVVHPFEGGAELRALVASLHPDVLLVLGPDELIHLHGSPVPIVLDCFAPRILEAQWQGPDITAEITRTLSALALADYVLVTHERTRHLFLGLLPLAGFDCREERLLTVPLSVPLLPEGWLPRALEARRSKTPLLLAGGVAWPWQDPSRALGVAARVLRRVPQARLELLRGPYPLSSDPQVPPAPIKPGRQVRIQGLLPYPALRSLYPTAWCALDLMAPNLEREVALSFRQLDALAAGLPLLTGTYAPLAPLLQSFEAGWVVPHDDDAQLEAVLTRLLTSPDEVERRGQQARALGEAHFHPVRTILPLVRALQQLSRRPRQETLEARLARRATEAAVQETTLALLQDQLSRVQGHLQEKNQTLEAAGEQARTLTTTVGRLSQALEEALALKRTHEEVASDAAHQQRLETQTLARELSRLKLDLHKKQEALVQESARRETLEHSLMEVHQLEERARHSADRLSLERTQALARATQAEERLETQQRMEAELRSQLERKEQALLELEADRRQQAAEQARLATRLEQTLLQSAREKEGLERALEESRRAFARSMAEQQTAMTQAMETVQRSLETTLAEARLRAETQLEEERRAQRSRLETEQARHALALEALRDDAALRLQQWQAQQQTEQQTILQSLKETYEQLLQTERRARQKEVLEAQAALDALSGQSIEQTQRHQRALEEQRQHYEQALQEASTLKTSLHAQLETQSQRQTALLEDQRIFYEQALQEANTLKTSLHAQLETQSQRHTDLLEDQRIFYEQALAEASRSKDALLQRLDALGLTLKEVERQRTEVQEALSALTLAHSRAREEAAQEREQLAEALTHARRGLHQLLESPGASALHDQLLHTWRRLRTPVSR